MDVTTWWTWATSYEPTLSEIDISTSVPAIITDSYAEAIDKTNDVVCYLSQNNYQSLVYKYALHILIINSRTSKIPQLKALYTTYDVANYAGIVQSAGDGSSSASKVIPNKLQDGDAQTLLLFSTPYGQFVEETFEQLRNIAIVQ